MNNDDTKYILTIDMGTTAFKAAVFDCEGREAGSATEEYQIQTPRPGWAEMDPEKYTELFKAAVSGAVKNAGISREDILTLGISCQGETSVFLDSDSRPLRPAIIWCDTRALQEAKEIVDAFGSTTSSYGSGKTSLRYSGTSHIYCNSTDILHIFLQVRWLRMTRCWEAQSTGTSG